MTNLLTLWRRPYRRYVLTLLCTTALVIWTSLLASVGHTQPEPARSANSFIDSIGVNTHLYYDDSVYYQNYNDIIKPKLQSLGVHHIRDGAGLIYNGYLDRLKDLGSLGIYANLIADPRSATPEQALEAVKIIGSAVEGVEGPNEYDSYQNADPNWVNTVRLYQQDLYQIFNGDSATNQLKVFAPTFADPSSYSKVGDLSAYIDFGNMHSYPVGQNPGLSGYGSLSYNTNLVQSVSGTSKQVVATETGYFNSAYNSPGVSEAAAGKYIPRLFLESFNYGIPRTYNYEFINEYNDPNNSELNFGLLRNDGSEKPAYGALKNLIGLLQDPGAYYFTPGALDYTLGGNTANVHHTLLQKSDSTFVLLLWQEVPCFDQQQRVDLYVPDVQVTLNLNSPIGQAATFEPLYSTNPTAQYTNPNQLALSVPDSPLVIALSPAS